MSCLDAEEDLIPRTQSAFRCDQVAKRFRVSTARIFNLIIDGEIVVAKKRIDSATSMATVLIPRKALVDFLRRRMRRALDELRASKSAVRKGRRTGKGTPNSPNS